MRVIEARRVHDTAHLYCLHIMIHLFRRSRSSRRPKTQNAIEYTLAPPMLDFEPSIVQLSVFFPAYPYRPVHFPLVERSL
jgi:hypothetical protein